MVPKTVKFTSRNGIKTHPEKGKEKGEKIHSISVALVQRSISALLCNTRRAFSRERHGSGTYRHLLPKVRAALLSQSNKASGQRLNTCSLLHQYAKKLQLTAPSNLFLTLLGLRQNTSHLTRFAFQLASLSH